MLISALGSVILYSAIGQSPRIAGILALTLWSTCGAMLMAGAGNLMTIFLGLELLSLALYCLCGIADRPTARESALKYLILSSTASGFMLYGMALLFGASGSVALADLANPALASNPLLWIGAALFLGRHRLQTQPRAVSRLVARRLRRRAAAGDRVHERRNQSGNACSLRALRVCGASRRHRRATACCRSG